MAKKKRVVGHKVENGRQAVFVRAGELFPMDVYDWTARRYYNVSRYSMARLRRFHVDTCVEGESYG